jgi:uncharacterized protein (DUF983 family)
MSEEQPTNPTGAGSTDRSAWTAMAHGARQRCPACGRGRLFRAFLKVDDRCPQCAEELSHHRADDAPAYFTMVIVGHVVVGGVLVLERAYEPNFWAHALLWLPVTVISSLLLLPRVKGALVGLQWALRMHGFAATPHVEPDRR